MKEEVLCMNRINNKYNSPNNDGTVIGFQLRNVDDKFKKLYILNSYDSKLLQFIFSTEEQNYAQIKIIPYNISKIVFVDQVDNEKKIYPPKDINNLEFTYHGANADDKTSKIHLKFRDKKTLKDRYKTLINASNILQKDTSSVIPLFSLLTGENSRNKKKRALKKNAHKFNVCEKYPQQIDFFFAGKNFNMDKYSNSFYSFQINYFSLDYLSNIKANPLTYVFISQPIEILNFGDFILFIRVSRSKYTGESILKFYNNVDYYDKFMNRNSMYLNNDKTLTPQFNMKEKALEEDLDYE